MRMQISLVLCVSKLLNVPKVLCSKGGNLRDHIHSTLNTNNPP